MMTMLFALMSSRQEDYVDASVSDQSYSRDIFLYMHGYILF